MKSTTIIIAFLFIFQGTLSSQNNTFYGNTQLSFLPAKKLSGPSLSLFYGHKLNERSQLEVGYESTFLTGRGKLPKDDVRGDDYHIFDKTTPNASGNSNSVPLQLSSHPDKYNVSQFILQYRFLFTTLADNFSVTVGASFADHKSTEIVQFIEGELSFLPNSATYFEGFIPIYKFEHYFDFGPTVGLDYKKAFQKGIYIRGGLNYKHFIHSNTDFLSVVFGVGFDF